jgi:hypothetical protein
MPSSAKRDAVVRALESVEVETAETTSPTIAVMMIPAKAMATNDSTRVAPFCD